MQAALIQYCLCSYATLLQECDTIQHKLAVLSSDCVGMSEVMQHCYKTATLLSYQS
jgi:hypothetical protein